MGPGWRPRWPMGHGSHGSWVKSSMGHLGHGSLWVTHSLLCVADRHISISQLLWSCCYLFTVFNSGLLSVHRPRPASHAHFGHRQLCEINSSIDYITRLGTCRTCCFVPLRYTPVFKSSLMLFLLTTVWTDTTDLCTFLPFAPCTLHFAANWVCVIVFRYNGWPAKMGFMPFRQPSSLCFDAVSFTAVLFYRGE